jgi:hypothetical protein
MLISHQQAMDYLLNLSGSDDEHDSKEEEIAAMDLPLEELDLQEHRHLPELIEELKTMLQKDPKQNPVEEVFTDTSCCFSDSKPTSSTSGTSISKATTPSGESSSIQKEGSSGSVAASSSDSGGTLNFPNASLSFSCPPPDASGQQQARWLDQCMSRMGL